MPYDTASPPPIAAQSNALRTLLRLSELHPQLPGAYVVSHGLEPNRIDVQLNSPSSLEAWREALNAPTDSVKSRPLDAKTQLEISAEVGSVTVRVYAIFVSGGADGRECS